MMEKSVSSERGRTVYWVEKTDSPLTLVFLPENENMNLRTNHALADQFVLRRLRP